MSKQVISFQGIDCHLVFRNYLASGNIAGPIAIELVAASTKINDEQNIFVGEPIATVTVNKPEFALAENEIIVKTWSENFGILETLEEAGVLTRTEKLVDFGFVFGVIATLNEEYRK